MEKHEIKTENFHCLKLNAQALLTFEYRVVDENNKILVRFDCDKKLECGIAKKECRRCGRNRAHIDKYGLDLCRQCFRENAIKLGFKKYY